MGPLVKWKALRVIRHVAEKGQIDFKRGMQRNQDKFREAAHYRGEPDPLHGDAFNTRVRETAADVLNFLYQTESHNSGASFGQTRAGFGGGMGNDSSNIGGFSGGNSSFGGSSGGNWGESGDYRMHDYAPNSGPMQAPPGAYCCRLLMMNGW